MAVARGPKTAAEKKRMKYAAYMRDIGTPLFVTDAERAELVAHLTKLKEAGMSYAQIAASAPGSRAATAVAKILKGWSDDTHRDTYTDLMQARYVEPVAFRSGSKVDPTGTTRRVQALCVAGFGYDTLAEMLGCTGQAVFQLATRTTNVMASTANRVAEVYDKIGLANPEDFGSSQFRINRAKGAARRRGWAPWSCWDANTIDDPLALPEWTGYCGTHTGYQIHRRDDIPLCGPCKAAGAGGMKFSGSKLRALREARGWSLNHVERELGLGKGHAHHWEGGRYGPRPEVLGRLMSLFDVTFEDLYEMEEV